MADFTPEIESRFGRRLRLFGLSIWVLTSVAGFSFGGFGLAGSGGAVGLCFLAAYVAHEQRLLIDQLDEMKKFFGVVSLEAETQGFGYVASIGEDDKQQYQESVSDYNKLKSGFLSDIRKVEKTELAMGVIFTLQWAYLGSIGSLWCAS